MTKSNSTQIDSTNSETKTRPQHRRYLAYGILASIVGVFVHCGLPMIV